MILSGSGSAHPKPLADSLYINPMVLVTRPKLITRKVWIVLDSQNVPIMTQDDNGIWMYAFFPNKLAAKMILRNPGERIVEGRAEMFLITSDFYGKK